MRWILSLLILVAYCYGSMFQYWMYDYSSQITCMIDNGETIILGTNTGDVLYVNATTGDHLWYRNLTLPIGTCVSDGTYAYFGINDSPSSIYRLHLDYHNISLDSLGLNPSDDYLSASYYYNGYLFLGTSSSPGNLIQVDTETFKRVYGFQFASALYSFVSSIQVYNDQILYSFNTSSGPGALFNYTNPWVSYFGGAGSSYYPTTGAIIDDTVYYFGYTNSVISYNLPTGTTTLVYPLPYINRDVTVSMAKNYTIYFGTKSGTISLFFVANYTRGPLYYTTQRINCGFRKGDYLYFGGYDSGTSKPQITQQYIGNDCPDAVGGLLLSGTSRTVYMSAPTCSASSCINGTISCLNAVLSGNTNYNYTYCALQCDCNYTINSQPYKLDHNTTTTVYYYPDSYCGPCTNTSIYCYNGTLTLSGTALVNTSNIHSTCPEVCSTTMIDCLIIFEDGIENLPHNSTTYGYSISQSCGNCQDNLVPVHCLNGTTNILTSNLYINCYNVTCVKGCTKNGLIFPLNSTIPLYSQKSYCGDCVDVQSSVYCSDNGTIIGNYSNHYLNCTSTCEFVYLQNTSANVTLDNVVVYFPQAANYTATFSVANSSNALYRDPSMETFGNYLGTSFFITFYKSSIETHIPPPGTFLEISTNYTENTFLFYFDTDSNAWVKNCLDPTILVNNVLRVELCHATQYALFKLTFDVPSSSSNPKDITVIVIIVIVLVAVIGGLAGLLVYYRRRIKRGLRDSAIELIVQSTVKDIKVLNRLGGGNFGEVYRGEWKGSEVALKKLKSSANYQEFIKESEMLSQLSHPHIVQFIGIYVNESNEQFIVTEFMKRGDLLSLLRNDKSIQLLTLYQMARQACSGMVYLADRNIVHRDLALRNLLVMSGDDKNYIVKVSDFGLSRSIGEDNYYTKESAQLPVKWSAIESLKYGKFSTKSDVWSFGVCLWELFSRGEMPYFTMTNSEAMEKIVEGYRLPQPEGCTQEMYKLMLSCWNVNPDERPTFEKILEIIEKLNNEPKLSEPTFIEVKENSSEQIYN